MLKGLRITVLLIAALLQLIKALLALTFVGLLIWAGVSIYRSSAVPQTTASPRSNFITFYGQLSGAEQVCDDPSRLAQEALNRALKDVRQSLAAYSAAETAHDACDSAGPALAMIAKPGSLSHFKLDDILTASLVRVDALRDQWYDVAQVLNAGAADLALQSTLNGHIKDVQSSRAVETADVAEIMVTLKIDSLKDIAPIPPSI